MLRLQIDTRGEIRFGQLGDWWVNGAGTDCVEVLDLGDPREEFCIALHELIESFLCKHRGVAQELVDDFDREFTGAGEPGDDPDCPYGREHLFATRMERMMCAELGMEWDEYLKSTDVKGEQHEQKRLEQDHKPAA